MKNPRILIVEDDAISVASLKQIVEQMGYAVSGIAASGEEALSLASSENPDVILMDIRLRGKMSGIEAAEQIRSQLDVPVIYLTAYSEENLLDEASETQPYGYLVKPVRDRELRASIETALYKAEADRRLKHLNQMLRSVREVNQLITREKDRQILLDEACQILYQVHDYMLVWIGIVEGEKEKVNAVAWAGEDTKFIEETNGYWEEVFGEFPGRTALQKREVVICEDIAAETSFTRWREAALAYGFQSSGHAPILHERRVFGVLCVLSERPNTFSPEEIELLQELANDLGFALYNLELEEKRKRAEEALRTSEERFSTVFFTSPIGITITRIADGQVIDINPAFLEMFGFSRDDVIGRTTLELSMWADPDERGRLIGSIREQGRIYGYETKGHRKTGEIIELLVSAEIIELADEPHMLSLLQNVTERKQAEEALQESEEKYRTLVEAADDSIILMDPSGKHLFANSAYYTNLGYEVGDDPNQDGFSIIHPDDVAMMRAGTSGLLEKGPLTAEYRVRHRDGNWRHRYSKSTLIRDHSGNPSFIISIVRDVTDRKQAEEDLRASEDRYRDLVDNSQDLICTHDLEGRILSANPWACKVLGYSKEEILRMKLSDFLTPKGRELFPGYQEDIRRDGSAQGILLVQTKSGEKRIWEFSNSLRTEGVSAPVVRGIARDITERIQAEKKIQQQLDDLALLDALNRAVNRGEDLADIIHLLSEETKKIFSCHGATVYLLEEDHLVMQRLNLPPQLQGKIEALIGRSIPTIKLPLNEDNPYYEIIKSGEPRLIADPQVVQRLMLAFTETIQMPKKARTAIGKLISQIYRLIDIRSVIIVPLIVEGKPLGIVEISSSQLFTENEVRRLATISEQVAGIVRRKKATQALVERLKEQTCLYAVSRDAQEDLSLEELCYRVLDHLVKAMQFPEIAAPVIELGGQRFAHSNNHTESTQSLFAEIKAGDQVCGKLWVNYLESKSFLLPDEQNLVEAVADLLGLWYENKQAEEELRESEERLKEAQALGRIGSWEFDLDNQTIQWSDQVYQLYERDPALGPPTVEEEAAYYSPEQAQKLKDYTRQAVENEQIQEYDLEARLPSGRIAHYTGTMRPIKNEKDKVMRLAGTVQDITERKKAEEALQSSEKRFRALIEYSSEAILLLSPEFNIIYDSTTSGRILGYKDEIIIDQNLADWIHPQDMPHMADLLAQVLKEPHKEFRTECRVRHRDGSWVWVEGSLTNLLTEPGVQALVVNYHDITERKQAEEALRKSEADLKEAQAVANVGNWVWHIQSNQLEWSDQMYRIFGIDKESFTGSLADVIAGAIHPEDRAAVERSNLLVIQDKKPTALEYRVIWPDDRVRVVWSADGDLILDEAGKLSKISGIVQDITERKRAEEALRGSEEKYRNLVERANDGIVIIQDTMVRFANARLAEMWHGTVEEIVDRPFSDYICSDELPKIADRYQRRMTGEEVPATYETRLLRKDGSAFSVELNAGVINYMGSMADLVLVRDITQRKQDEQALRESEERYRSLFEGVPVGLYRSTRDGRLLEVNHTMAQMFGYPDRQTMLASSALDLYVNPEDRQEYIDRVEGEGEAVEFEMQLRKLDGQAIWVRDIMRATKDTSGKLLYYEGNMEDITERKQEDQDRNERLNRALRQQKALIEMSFHPAIIQGEFEEAVKFIIETVAETTDTERVSVWLFEDQQRILRCIDLFEKPKGCHSKGLVFQAKDFPNYFSAFMTSQVIDAHDAQSDPRTEEFNERYLNPLGITSVLDSAIRVRGEVIGVLSQEHIGNLRSWNDDEIIFADAVGNYAVTVWLNRERAQVEEELRRRNQELGMLYETAIAISSHISLDAVLRTVAEQLTSALDVSGCTLSLWKPEENTLETLLDFSEASPTGKVPPGKTYDLSEYPSTRRVLTTGNPVVIQRNDPNADKAEVALMEQLNEQTLMMLPLIIGDQVRGLVEIYDEEKIRDFTPAEIRLAWSMISQATVSIENARLYEQAQQEIAERKRAEEQTQHRVEELASLYETASDMAKQTDLSSLLKTITQRAAALLGAMSSDIYLFDAKREELEIAFTSTPLVQVGTRLALGEGAAGRVASTRKPLIIEDYSQWEGRSPQYEGIPFTSVIQAPMIYRGELVGIISAENFAVEGVASVEGGFSEEDTRLLSMFASQAASAVYNARLLDTTRQRLTELEMLYEGGLSFSQLLQPEELGQKIIEVIEKKMAWHHAALRLYNPQNETLRLIAFSQPGIEDEKAHQAVQDRFEKEVSKTDRGLSGWAVKSVKTIRCADVTQDKHYVETHPNVRSGLYVPLKIGKRILGVISVESEEANAFSATDERLLETLMNQAAIALDNARLLGDARRRLQRNMALRDIDIVISSSLDLKLTFKSILERAIEQLEVDAADILLLDQDTAVLEYAAGNGFRTPALQYTRLPLGEGYAGVAALEKRRVYISELQNRKTDFLRSPHFLAESFVAYYAMPLIAKGRVRGVLEIFNRSPILADQEWLDFLEMMAGQAAIAIDSISLFDELQKSNAELSLAYDATIEGWSRALDLRDKETEGHTQRVTEMTIRLAREMGIKDEGLLHVQRGALLHDIGKMGVPDNILNKPGSLTDEEKKIMYEHPVFAYGMLSPIVYLRLALDIPYCHHERWDGTGYPRGLKDEQIPLAARIFAVVDVYDALISDRPYRLAWSKEKAIEHIREQSGKHFDPKVVDAFLPIFSTIR